MYLGSPPIPKEHGAWALLYGPFLLALTVQPSFEPRVIALFAAMSALFLAHEPLAKLARTARHPVAKARSRHWKIWSLIYLVVAATGGAYLLWRHHLWLLIPAGLVVGFLLIIHLRMGAERKERSVAGELTGVIGLTASAPITNYVVTGLWDSNCVLLWVLTFLYFASGIFFVKMKISRFTKPADYLHRMRHCFGYHAFVCLALFFLVWCKSIPPLLSLAYVPILVRAFAGILLTERRLNVRRIGYTELMHTALFVVLFGQLWERPF
jgi:hypothetical protein